MLANFFAIWGYPYRSLIADDERNIKRMPDGGPIKQKKQNKPNLIVLAEALRWNS